MTITNTFTAGTQAQAAQVNKNFRDTKWSPQVHSHEGLGIREGDGDTLVHSATTWTRFNGVGSKRTTDTGATWVAVTTGVANLLFGKVSDADGTKAISFRNGDLNVAISSDSGDVWTQATTDPADQPFCLSFPTATVAVMGTAKSAGARGIYFSTDAGDNWTICTTGPVVDVLAISMFSSTTGFAIADAGAIWKTTDGGDNWTDTTHTTIDPLVGTDIKLDILALSATEFILMGTSSPSVRFYDASGNPTVTNSWTFGGTNAAPFNPIKLTNGDIILGWSAKDADNNIKTQIIKIAVKDDKNCEIMEVLPGTQEANSYKDTGSLWSSILKEFDTNKIMVVRTDHYVLIDES